MPLPCGHDAGCMYRYRHRGITNRYCMACVVEKVPEANIDVMYKKQMEKVDVKDEVVAPPRTKVKKGRGETNVSKKI